MRALRLAAFVVLCAAALLMCPVCASADLSAKGAFVLLRRIAPGTEFKDANAFLGRYSGEWAVDEAAGIKVRRWGTSSDEWYFDVLHDGRVVRASRITWQVSGRRDQQHTFSHLTTEGKKFFGKNAKFVGQNVAEWTELEETILVSVRMGDRAEDGVTMLTGIRNDEMESAKYGF